MTNNTQNSIFKFLNGLASDFFKKIKETLFDVNVVSDVHIANFPTKQLVQLDDVEKIITALQETLDKNAGKVKVEIDIQKYVDGLETMRKAIREDMERKIKPLLSEIEVKFPEMPKFPTISDFPKSFSVEEADEIISVLKQVVSSVKRNQTKIDLRKIENELVMLRQKMPKITFPELPMEEGRIAVILPKSQMITNLGKKLDNISGTFAGGVTVNPKTQLSRAGGEVINPAREDYQSRPGGTPYIYNKNLILADTDYTQTLPDGTCILVIKPRENNITIKYAFASITGGAEYITLTYGQSLTLYNLNLQGKTLYLQCTAANKNVEIQCFTP